MVKDRIGAEENLSLSDAHINQKVALVSVQEKREREVQYDLIFTNSSRYGDQIQVLIVYADYEIRFWNAISLILKWETLKVVINFLHENSLIVSISEISKQNFLYGELLYKTNLLINLKFKLNFRIQQKLCKKFFFSSIIFLYKIANSIKKKYLISYENYVISNQFIRL